MGAWLPVVVTLPFVGILLASGVWAHRRFARFEELPGHYDFRGKPTRMAPRSVMVWMLPILFSATLLVIALATSLLPADAQNGDPVAGAIIGGVTVVAAQALVLWLTERWASRQV